MYIVLNSLLTENLLNCMEITLTHIKEVQTLVQCVGPTIASTEHHHLVSPHTRGGMVGARGRGVTSDALYHTPLTSI